MKKVFFVLLLFFFLFSTPIFANKVSTESSELQKVGYSLPFPGILPTSRLYFLKTTRDRIISFLISDPIKKSEFYLLQSDKRMSAVYALDKEKVDDKIIFSTVSKSQKYLEKALESAKEAKNQGLQTSLFLEKLKSASKKHAEVLLEMENKSVSLRKQSLHDAREKILEFEKSVK